MLTSATICPMIFEQIVVDRRLFGAVPMQPQRPHLLVGVLLGLLSSYEEVRMQQIQLPLFVIRSIWIGSIGGRLCEIALVTYWDFRQELLLIKLDFGG